LLACPGARGLKKRTTKTTVQYPYLCTTGNILLMILYKTKMYFNPFWADSDPDDGSGDGPGDIPTDPH